MGVSTAVDTARVEAWTFDVDDRLTRLFDTHHRRLFLLARRLSGSHEEARDLVQETFLRIARRPGAALPTDAAGELAWLMRTTINLCHDQRRRRAVRVRHLASSPPPAHADSPEEQYVAGVAVWQALNGLDARRRAIVVLHEIDGESVEWIAKTLGIAPVTVRWHLARARRVLARILG